MHVVTVLVEVCTRFVRSVVLVNDAHVCTAFSWRFSGRAFVHVLGVGAGPSRVHRHAHSAQPCNHRDNTQVLQLVPNSQEKHHSR